MERRNNAPLTGAELDLQTKWVLCQLVLKLIGRLEPHVIRTMIAELQEEEAQRKQRGAKK